VGDLAADLRAMAARRRRHQQRRAGALDAAWHGFQHAYYDAPRVRRPGSTGRIVGGYTFRPVFDAMAAIRDRAGLEPWPYDPVRLVPGGCEGCDR
jgi:hypothetical protein